MKTLLIMRHAKSSWDSPAWSDHERPLNKRGLGAAPRMGKLLHEQSLVPEAILSSTAHRARQTAELVAEHAGFQDTIVFVDDLYLATPTACIDVIREEDPSVDRILLVAHNPGLQELVRILTGCSETMVTAAVACVILEINHWRALVSEVSGHLQAFWIPRELDQ